MKLHNLGKGAPFFQGCWGIEGFAVGHEDTDASIFSSRRLCRFEGLGPWSAGCTARGGSPVEVGPGSGVRGVRPLGYIAFVQDS